MFEKVEEISFRQGSVLSYVSSCKGKALYFFFENRVQDYNFFNDSKFLLWIKRNLKLQRY
jgi:hypothetical protein